MERWRDQGLVLGMRGHGEGAAVVTLLTANNGRFAGYVHGGHSSQRLRAAYQLGALVDVEWSSQTHEQLGQFTLEDSQGVNMAWLDDAAALCALQSVCAFLEKTLAEREPHNALFTGTQVFLSLLGQEKTIWAAAYIFWELALLREMGFALDLSKCAVTGDTDDLRFVSPKSGKAVSAAGAGAYKDRLLILPNFLCGGGQITSGDIEAGLKLSAYFIEHRLFAHTTHTMPEARLRLPSFFKDEKTL